MNNMSPEKKALVLAFRDANPTDDASELKRLRDLAEFARVAAAEAQQALAQALIREREAEVEAKRAKSARIRMQGRVRFAELQRQELCEKLDEAEWLSEVQSRQEAAERVIA